jgi:outer membrane protein OmpA-like peptidoglycan-associated protein
VPDGIDQCADTPQGTPVDARGCPRDSDNDGVPDGVDQCADTPSGTQVDARGCPIITDADHDGVPDDKDKCPFTPANVKVDKDGCPIELSEREVELLDKGRITERNIHFETAKWDILPESLPVLDEIGAVLIQWPQLRIEIGGHADARGSDAYNLDLSDKRANAVLEYLVGKYPQITREQYTSKGYGERVPVASNKTVEGMARNRRVEFKVLNTEELKKERERRRLLKTNE